MQNFIKNCLLSYYKRRIFLIHNFRIISIKLLVLLLISCACAKNQPHPPIDTALQNPLVTVKYPIKGVTLLSWNEKEIPTAVSWIPQTWKSKPPNCGSLAIQKASISTSKPFKSHASLELEVNLRKDHPHFCEGEVFVDLRYHPPQCQENCSTQQAFVAGSPIDMKGGCIIKARVYATKGIQGPLDMPNGFQLFLKSIRKTEDGRCKNKNQKKDSQWCNYYGNWKNIESGWNTLELQPDIKPRYGMRDEHFDPSRVCILGLKIGSGKSQNVNFRGKIWLDEVTIKFNNGCEVIYDFEEVENSLDVLQGRGCNWISLIPTWYMDCKFSNSLHRDNLKTGAKTYPDYEIINTIKELHKRGFHILLKPHVDIQDSTWRGEIKPRDIKTWFNNYQLFISHYASLANENKVELFSVGTELETMQGEQYREYWISIIQEIRRIYNGPLIYSANWDLRKGGGYNNVSFWDFVDYLGIDAYFPLNNNSNPSLENIINGWTNYIEKHGSVETSYNWIKEIETFQEKHQKPIIFTEIGYPSTDYAAKEPWKPAEEFFNNNSNSAVANTINQALCYEAVNYVFSGKPYFHGLFWWGWSPFADAGGYCDTSYTSQNKNTENFLYHYQRREK